MRGRIAFSSAARITGGTQTDVRLHFARITPWANDVFSSSLLLRDV
jgi:hypothetical protein